MSLDINTDRSTDEAQAEALIFKTVCARADADSATDLKALWSLEEPWAGRGTQVIWLCSYGAEARPIVKSIAPFTSVVTSDCLDLNLRQIVVCYAETWPNKVILKDILRDPVIVSIRLRDTSEGVVTVETPSPVEFLVPANSIKAAAASAGVIAALITKWPEASNEEIQKALINSAKKPRTGTPVLRRVHKI